MTSRPGQHEAGEPQETLKVTYVEVMTPGSLENPDWADGWDVRTGMVHHCFAVHKNNQLFRKLLEALPLRYPARCNDRIEVGVDHHSIQQARPVQD